jgi:hypothetical protein
MARATQSNITRSQGTTSRYRCFCLTDDGRILWGTRLHANGLAEAIAAAREACRAHIGRECLVEVWQRSSCLFTESAP